MASILIVEDDKLLGHALKDNFEMGGFEAHWAEESTKAFEILKTTAINIVLLDIMLPGMNGYDILKTIRSTPDWQNIHVIMLSNFGQIDEINRAMEIGANDYVIKANIDLAKLTLLVKEKLNIS